MYTIDASVFVRDLDPTEPEHAVCHTLLERLDVAGLPIIVPVLLLVELAGTVSRTRRDPLRARVVVLGLRGLPHLTLIDLDDALAQEAADMAADYRLRGADAVYVAVARRFGTTLVTLDVEQRSRSGGLLTSLTPAEALAQLSSS